MFKLGEQVRQTAPAASVATPRAAPPTTPAPAKRLSVAKPQATPRAAAKAPAGDDWEEF